MGIRYIALCGALLLLACGGENGKISLINDQSGATDLPVVDIASAKDEVLELRFPETADADLGMVDIERACPPGSGCFLDPCDEPGDCLTGLCVDHMGDSVCTIVCVEECPDGWVCQQIGAGPDAMFACISPYTHLCRPCADGNDCQAATGVEDVCVAYGNGGSFCGADCSTTGVCPEGYVCQAAVTVEGGQVTQCMPMEGECTCSAKAVKLGLTTPCLVENEFGVCPGLRTCGEEGLADCDALVPALEECNGVDDDCDGQTDDQFEDTEQISMCDDDNQCTADFCQGEAGCLSEPLTGDQCDDGDACTAADACQNGVCGGEPVVCVDDNPCTDDSCDSALGCLNEPNQLPCDDEDPCTVNDTCSEAQCVGFAVPCECEEDEDCEGLDDNDLCNGTLFCDTVAFPQSCALDAATVIECPSPEGLGAECLSPACHPMSGDCSLVPANQGGACSDGNACTVGEECDEGACAGGIAANCNDGNGCTTDSCVPDVGCLHEPNSEPCDDENVCTVGDLCSGAECVSGEALLCDDGNPCTDDACDPAVGCTHENNLADCTDNNSCTIGDHCDAGQCVGDGQLDCDDGNPCTADLCQPDGGCAHEDSQGACNDGNPCSLNDYCLDGVCVSGPLLDCNDGNVCTEDECEAGVCVHDAVLAACDDGNACTKGDHCQLGGCTNQGAVNCDDANVCTTDWCDPANGCVHDHNALPCDDANACTAGDACKAGACLPGASVNCNDGNLCTDDTCEPVAGCLNNANANPCSDGDVCTTGDVCSNGACLGPGNLDCDDGNVCTDDTCDPVAGCKHVFNQSDCNDGDPCSTGDQCKAGACLGTGVLDCNDAKLCTDDSCDSDAGCVHQPNTLACDDGNACTLIDVCSGGSCSPGGLIACDDNNLCTDDSCDTQAGCVYSSNVLACDDSNECTTADACLAGACVGGPPADCDDGNPCTIDICLWDQGCEHYPVAVGADAGVCAVCDGKGGKAAPSDDDECLEIDCSNWFVSSGAESPTGTQQCHNKHSLVSGRCEGMADCKDANTDDCAGQPNESLQYECGVCRHIAAGHCEGNEGGSCSSYEAGTVTGVCSVCDGQGNEEAPVDDEVCGVLTCSGLDHYFTDGGASVSGTNYCKQRKYEAIGSARCEGLGDCKDANSDDCSEFTDSTVAECGVCKYAEGACSVCTNYADETDCGSGKWCQSGACVAAAQSSCKGWYDSGSKVSGTHTINPGGLGPYQVYCDMTTQGGGWTKVNSLSAAAINKIMGNNAKALYKCSDSSGSYFMSPTFSHDWSWSSKKTAPGTWIVNGTGRSCGNAGEFYAASYGWGIGCSNGGGGHEKWYPGMCDNCGFPCNCGIPKGHTNKNFSVCGSNNYGSYAAFVREN